MTICIGTLDTDHFEFNFYGNSRAEVTKLARDGWKAHCSVYTDADPDYMEKCIEEGRLEIVEVKVPSALRDGEELKYRNRG